jgi:hypothetical protein
VVSVCRLLHLRRPAAILERAHAVLVAHRTPNSS